MLHFANVAIYAGQVSLLFLTFSLIGWIVFLVGTSRIVKVLAKMHVFSTVFLHFYSRLVDADISVFQFYFSPIWAEVVVGLIVFCLAFSYTLTRGVCSYVLGSIVSSHQLLLLCIVLCR